MKEIYTTDVYGDGECFVMPKDWHEKIVPAAVASFVLGDVTINGHTMKHITPPIRAYTPHGRKTHAWIVIRVTGVDDILARVQRMQEGV